MHYAVHSRPRVIAEITPMRAACVGLNASNARRPQCGQRIAADDKRHNAFLVFITNAAE